MPIGAQPPGRRGTVDQPYSPLNLRLALAVWLWRQGHEVPAWLLGAWALVAVVDIVVVQLRRRARRRAEGGRRHSLFE